MAQLDRETVRHLAKLCRIAVTPEEEEMLTSQMKKIVDYVDFLQTADTEGVQPCTYVTEGLSKTPVRKDEPSNELSQKAVLANAPDIVGAFFRVPQVLKQE